MSSRCELTLELIRDDSRPKYLNLAETIIQEIERGRLKPGQILPGTRALAKLLGLHRNTVDTAYHELTMQGWLMVQPSRGTFVSGDLPVLNKTVSGARPVFVQSNTREKPSAEILHITDGTPDPRILPRADLARAFRMALNTSFLRSGSDYFSARGTKELRQALAEHFLNARGLSTSSEDLMITRGSQMGLFLAASAILRPGESIAVETPGYPYAWGGFRASGARIIGIPVDRHGIDVDYLEMLVNKDPTIRAVYVTPHHQYPTTVTLGAARRLKLLDLARAHDLFIIEDDYDHDYRFDSQPVLPLAARGWDDQRIIHVGSLSKLTAPVLRLGYVVAPPEILNRMTTIREVIDRQGDAPLEQALALMMTSGVLERHARKARRVYSERRNFLVKEFRRQLGDVMSFDVPAGGLAIWLNVHQIVNVDDWAASAEKNGLHIATGKRFSLGHSKELNSFRFGYANLNNDELRKAVTILERALSSLPSP